MSASFPSNAPRHLKGALIGVDPFNPLASVVVFQYNPETMSRRLEPRGPAADGERGEAFRLSGPPKETITLSVEIDATDQLAEAHPLAVASGIGPTLAALEMMLYPKSALVIANTVLAAVGTVVLCLSKEVAVKAASAMLMMEAAELNSDVIDAVGELTNMVAGAAKAELEELSLSISLPNVILGKGHEVHFPSNVTPICVPFSCEWGELAIEVGLVPIPEPVLA